MAVKYMQFVNFCNYTLQLGLFLISVALNFDDVPLQLWICFATITVIGLLMYMVFCLSEVSIHVQKSQSRYKSENRHRSFVPKVILKQFESGSKINSWHAEKIHLKVLLASRNPEMPVLSNAVCSCCQWCCICLICHQWPMFWAVSDATHTLVLEMFMLVGWVNHSSLHLSLLALFLVSCPRRQHFKASLACEGCSKR